MATISEKSGATQLAVISTEHTLLDTADSGVYEPEIDMTNLAAGTTPDIVEIRVYTKTRAGEAYKQYDVWTFQGGLIPAGWAFKPGAILAMHGWKLTLKQVQGTGRNFTWGVKTIA